MNKPKYLLVIRNRFTRTVYSIQNDADVYDIYRAQLNNAHKFWIKIEVEYKR